MDMSRNEDAICKTTDFWEADDIKAAMNEADDPIWMRAASPVNHWVVNFSSALPLRFINGQVLGACSEERRRRLTLWKEESRMMNRHGWLDVALTDRLTTDILGAIYRIVHRVNLPFREDEPVVILCQQPLLRAWDRYSLGSELYLSRRSTYMRSVLRDLSTGQAMIDQFSLS